MFADMAQGMFPKKRRLLVGLGLAFLLTGTALSLAKDNKVKDLPKKHQEWLKVVELIMSKEELKAFLALEADYRRDEFIAAFWKARDPRPATHDNAFKELFEARREEGIERFGGMEDARARIFVLQGEPADVRKTDCGVMLWPLEIWSYGSEPRELPPVSSGNEFLPWELTVLFYQPFGGGPFRVWRPTACLKWTCTTCSTIFSWRAWTT